LHPVVEVFFRLVIASQFETENIQKFFTLSDVFLLGKAALLIRAVCSILEHPAAPRGRGVSLFAACHRKF